MPIRVDFVEKKTLCDNHPSNDGFISKTQIKMPFLQCSELTLSAKMAFKYLINFTCHRHRGT